MKPEDVLPDDQDSSRFGAEAVRKGTVGAFLANAKIIERESVGWSEYDQAVSDLIALLPKVKALGVFEVFDVKPGRVREIIEKNR